METMVRRISDPLQHGEVKVEFADLVTRSGLCYRRGQGVSTNKVVFDPAELGDVIQCDKHSGGMQTLIQISDVPITLAYINVYGHDKSVYITVASTTMAAADEGLTKLISEFPPLKAEENTVPMTFWSRTPHGFRQARRELDVPEWAKIRDNYSASTRDNLDTLMAWKKNVEGGKLILWHGEPGTGKTYALRALAREWKDWCDIAFIADPERFFGEADYMLDVLLDEPDDGRWRCLVLEDTGELLVPDAREKTGQGLSRLLNVVDGLIGQGLRLFVLITSNEALGKMHPAVTRPGRCAMDVDFQGLSKAEAQSWMERNGFDLDLDRGRKLAELFAEAHEFHNRKKTPVKVGF